MPSPEEAREEAWEELSANGRYGADHAFFLGWDARGRYDEQRIAELVAWVEDALNTGDIGIVLYERGEALLRALGQSEEVKP